MASLKSKILIGLMRKRHWVKGQWKKPVMENSLEAVLAFRAECEKGAERFGKIPEGIEVKPEVIDTIISEWLIPEDAVPHKLLFYVHGGGYVSGSCNDHRSIVSKVTKATALKTLLFEYGLAPENPFPAALNDTVTIYQEVLKKGYRPENIIMMGESAGGGLCLASLLAIRDQNIPLPKAAVVISPWTDLSCSGESYRTKNKVSLAPLNSWTVFSGFYAAGNDLTDPYISPLFGELKGLPPLFINAGNADELFDDSRRFYEKAKQAEVDFTFHEGEDMIHCYPLLAPLFPEATKAMNEITGFIKHHLEQ
ncbi:alpha/beta hydrolase [Maribellus sediminis]|uniref:alpha/beta hydrolase n=1 Tax=Maribellus sediminis TaxID=2696285 RepID=UPI0014320FAC|nr:alpha/beta hydrolase [Maribellus sediminis]